MGLGLVICLWFWKTIWKEILESYQVIVIMQTRIRIINKSRLEVREEEIVPERSWERGMMVFWYIPRASRDCGWQITMGRVLYIVVQPLGGKKTLKTWACRTRQVTYCTTSEACRTTSPPIIGSSWVLYILFPKMSSSLFPNSMSIGAREGLHLHRFVWNGTCRSTR